MLRSFFTDEVSEIKVRGLILVLRLAEYSFSLKAWQNLFENSIFSLTFFAIRLSCLSQIFANVISCFVLLRSTLAVFRVLLRASTGYVQ